MYYDILKKNDVTQPKKEKLYIVHLNYTLHIV